MSENRKRNQTLSIRLTPAEKDAIVQQAAKARMSLTDYILTSALVTEIHVAEDTRPLITELKRIGNNLNQIAQFFHSGGFHSKSMQDEINRHLTALWQLRQEAIKLGGTYHGRVKTHRNKKR